MAVRDDFAPGEVLAAADLNDTFASKLPYSYGTATPSTTDSGFLWYDSNSTPAATKFWDGSAFVPFGGKILQVVRATDSTNRSTTSTSFVDANLSVTITPQKSDSAIMLVHTAALSLSGSSGGTFPAMFVQITDSSNNAISGADGGRTNAFGSAPLLSGAATLHNQTSVLIGYSTPATTSATTYKVRFRSNNAADTATLANTGTGGQTGQLYAIEVSA